MHGWGHPHPRLPVSLMCLQGYVLYYAGLYGNQIGHGVSWKTIGITSSPASCEITPKLMVCIYISPVLNFYSIILYQPWLHR